LILRIRRETSQNPGRQRSLEVVTADPTGWAAIATAVQMALTSVYWQQMVRYFERQPQ
jgi:hypothetical protein